MVGGRNRYLACEKLGIEPFTKCIENGKAFSEEELIDLARSYNKKRRQLSKMQSACIAALEWKRLHPEHNLGGDRTKKKQTHKNGFGDFAATNHGISALYADQALAVANWDMDRLQQAKEDPRGLADAYEDYRAAVSEKKLKARREKILQEHEDMFDRDQAGQLFLEEAGTLANDRNKERDEKERIRKSQAERLIRSIEDFIAIKQTPTALLDAVEMGLITEEQLKEKKEKATLVLKEI